MVVNKILNPGAQGDGLRHAFNQNQANSMDSTARIVPTPSGLNPEDENPESEEKSFVQCNPNPNLYNTENGNPPVSDTTYVEGGSNREARDVKRLSDIKLGNKVMYSGGEGTVVGRGNMMIKVADNETHNIMTVPVSETYFKDDMISTDGVKGQLWDLMSSQMRGAALGKANMSEVSKAYLYRDWHCVPDEVQDVIKEFNYFDGAPHGGVAGREPDHSGRNEESRNHRDLTQPRHVTEPYTDKQAPAFKTQKSDVEHGTYGGVVTDTPIDATDEYEDERPDKQLSGSQEEISDGPTGQSQFQRPPAKHPESPKEGKGVVEEWSETSKGEQQQAAITGKPDMKKQIGSYPSQQSMPTTKDEDQGVGPQSSGFQGAKPNAQSAEKGEQQQAAITGKPDLREGDETVEKEDGSTGPTFGDGPKHMEKSRNIINKYNTRWGMRQASEEDYKRDLERNP